MIPLKCLLTAVGLSRPPLPCSDLSIQCLQQSINLFKNLGNRPARACTPRRQIAHGTYSGAAPEVVRQQEHALLLGHHAVASPGRGIDAREAQRLIKWRVPDHQIGQHCIAH